jgi:hypothetical protein
VSVHVLARAAITFETPGGSTHAPVVPALAGGRERRLVLDSGSEVHLLTKELVDELGLRFEEGEEGVDHSGATMPSWSVEDLPLELGGAGLTLRDTVAIPAPKAFLEKGIDGGLSPQHLHPDAWAVVDMAADELLLVEAEDEALRGWLEARSPALTTLVLERDPAWTVPVVQAAIQPHPELPTMLNTGGRRTEFSATAVPGLSAEDSERLGGGVSGADVLGATVGEATLVVSGREIPVAALAIRQAMHDPQAMVGMDVMRGTVLAVAADVSRPVFWQV